MFEKILEGLADHLAAYGKLDLTEGFIDGTHAGEKKGGPLVGITRRGKATKIMAVADGNGLPLAVGIASGERAEVALVEETLDRSFVDEFPANLIGDAAYDSNKLDAALKEKGVEMISPVNPRHKNNTQDGRRFRRYRRRWKIERLFA